MEVPQLTVIKTVFDRLRKNPCRLDLGLFATPGSRLDKLTLSSWIVETAQMFDLSSESNSSDSVVQAGLLLNITTDEATRLFRVTYWIEPFASACIFSAYEYLDELAGYKFRYDLTETQEINSRKVLRLFAHQSVVEICYLRIVFFFATEKTDEVKNFEASIDPFGLKLKSLEDLLNRVEFLRRVPVEKVNEILSCKARGWLSWEAN